MATEYIKLKGKAFWCKVYDPDVYMGTTSWKLDFAPANDEELKKYTDAGIQKKVKEDAEKGKFFQLKRDSFKLMQGKVVNFTGPVITNSEDEVIVDFINTETQKRVYSFSNEEKSKIVRRGSPVTIGNGSDVEVTIAVYDTIKGKGHRLESIKILNLVEYVRDDKLPPVAGEDVQTPIQTHADTPEDKPKGKAPW